MGVAASSAELEGWLHAGSWQRIVDSPLPDRAPPTRGAALHLAIASLAALQLGDARRARAWAHEALDIGRPWPETLARAHTTLAELALHAGAFGEADRLAREAYEGLEPGATDWRSHLEVVLGAVDARYGHDEGLEQLQHGAEALEQTSHALASPALRTLAELSAGRGRADALDAAERAARIGHGDDRSRAHQLLAVAHARAGRQNLARHHLGEAQAVLVGTPSPALASALADTEGHVAWEGGDTTTAQRAWTRALDAARLAGSDERALRRTLAGCALRDDDLDAARQVLQPLRDDPSGALLAASFDALDATTTPERWASAWWRAYRLAVQRVSPPAPLEASLWERIGEAWDAADRPVRASRARSLAAYLGSDATWAHDGAPPPRHVGPYDLPADAHGPGPHPARHHAAGEGVDPLQVTVVASRDPRVTIALEARWERLRALAHPGLAAVLDRGRLDTTEAWALGLPADSPWVVTAPPSSRGLVDLVGSARWRQVRQVISELLASLAHLHAHRLVHGALSMPLVTLDAAGHPLLGGLDVAAPPPLATRAPEVADGRPADDPRTDLFALGVLCWQLVTGRPPFAADDPEALATAHRRGLPPLQPTSPVPAGFEGWLRRLLAVDPDARPPLAAEAAESLRRLGEPDPSATPLPVGRRTHGPSREPAPTLPPAWPAPAPPRRAWMVRPHPAPPCVGRHGVKASLWEALRHTLTHQAPGLIALRGAAGSGRSTLAVGLARAAETVGAARSVVVDGVPAQALAVAVRRHLRLRDDGAVDLATIAARTPHLSDEHRAGLVALLADRHHPAIPLAVATLLRSTAPARPLVVAFADAPDGDPLQLQVAKELLRRDAPVLVLLVSPREPSPELQSLLKRPDAQVVDPDALDEDEVVDLVQSWLPLASDTARRIARAAEGHLGRARGWVTHGQLTGQLVPAADGLRFDVVATEACPALQRFRHALAHTAPSVTDALAATLLPFGHGPEHRFRQVTQQLDPVHDPRPAMVEAGLLLPWRDGWRLPDAAIVEHLGEHLRASPHRPQVARAALGLLPRRGAVEQAELARAVGQPDATLGPLFRSAQQAHLDGDAARVDSLLTRYDRALDQLGVSEDHRQRVAAMLLRSASALASGRTERALELADDALRRVPTASAERAVALDAVAAARDISGDRETALRAWADAAKQWHQAGSPTRASEALLARAQALCRRGRADEATDALQHVADHPRRQLVEHQISALRGQSELAPSALADQLTGPWRARLHLTDARLCARAGDSEGARSRIARARRAVASQPQALRTEIAFVDAYVDARGGQVTHASRAAYAALSEGRSPELRPWGLALAALGVRRDEPATVAALAAAIERDILCDPDLAWALDEASRQAVDTVHALTLARLASAAWRHLLHHARP